MNNNINAKNKARREYYQKNKIKICKRLLNKYSTKAIKRITSNNTETVNNMYEKYPYAEYSLKYSKKLCYKYRVHSTDYRYQECMDAAMLAYMYSICQCSIKDYKDDKEHVTAYIRKVTQIYFMAAITISEETRNICIENGFRQVNVDEWNI